MGAVVWLFLFLQLCNFFAGFTVADEPNEEVKIEVVFLPEKCTQKSKKGDLMNAHYDGYLSNGTKFYCSRSEKDGHPKWFVLGVGQVIKGLDIGMKGMCPGEKRKLTIPPSLGFGKQGKADLVPPNATLTFEVELHHISRGPRSMEAFREMDFDNSRSLTKDEIRKFLVMEDKKGGKVREDSFYDAVITDVFRKSDHNGDGEISAKEYNVYEHDEL
ncbi:peptidyl-prolyl cis-trans isomerase FKBP7 [Megalops cyprinoides]|uniref:peptidyl-prolyl cis-trans isomerase FKBP7 n=1 Tax=Megalops cyprinoides TaxID=118141 RepID=UPI00186526B4|nr:peptidyl-prolyl cis-trans isomerase FKBP7 [Megalops cyprinoides]